MIYLIILLFSFNLYSQELEFTNVPIKDENGSEHSPLQFAVKSDTILVLTTDKKLLLSINDGVSFKDLSDRISALSWNYDNFEEKIHPYSMLLYGRKYVNQIAAYTLKNLDDNVVFETPPIALFIFDNIAVHPKYPTYVYLSKYIYNNFLEDESFYIFKYDTTNYKRKVFLRTNKLIFNYSIDGNILMNSIGFLTISGNDAKHELFRSYNYFFDENDLVESNIILDESQHCYGCYSDYSIYLNKYGEKRILNIDFQKEDTISITNYEDIANINLSELNKDLNDSNKYDLTHSNFILNLDNVKNQIRVFNFTKRENNEIINYNRLYYRTLDAGDTWDLIYQNNELVNPISAVKINPTDGLLWMVKGERDENGIMINPKLYKSNSKISSVEKNNTNIKVYLSNNNLVIENNEFEGEAKIKISDILGNEYLNINRYLSNGINEIKIDNKMKTKHLIVNIISENNKYVFKIIVN